MAEDAVSTLSTATVDRPFFPPFQICTYLGRPACSLRDPGKGWCEARTLKELMAYSRSCWSRPPWTATACTPLVISFSRMLSTSPVRSAKISTCTGRGSVLKADPSKDHLQGSVLKADHFSFYDFPVVSTLALQVGQMQGHPSGEEFVKITVPTAHNRPAFPRPCFPDHVPNLGYHRPSGRRARSRGYEFMPQMPNPKLLGLVLGFTVWVGRLSPVAASSAGTPAGRSAWPPP